jgi:hypothetical protein
MQGKSHCASVAGALCVVVFGIKCLPAATLVVSTVDQGWYDERGFHDFNNMNYLVGNATGFGMGAGYVEYRNFFVFDLSTVSKPIASATLALYELPPPHAHFSSGDGSENYELHEVATAIETLTDGLGDQVAFHDLGDGAVYGTRLLTASDMGTYVEVPLSASGVAALNSANGEIAIGGSITTLDSLPNKEFAFGHSGDDAVQLRLEIVPEPGHVVLFCTAAAVGCIIYRRRPQRIAGLRHAAQLTDAGEIGAAACPAA